VENKVVAKLAEVLANDFPQTEEAYAKVHADLNSSRVPPAEVAFAAQQAVAKLLAKLRDIRAGVGQGLDLKKIITDLEDQIKQKMVTKQILAIIEQERGKEIREVVVHPAEAPVSLTPGQKLTVRIPVTIGAAYNGKFQLKLETFGDDIKVPSTINLPEDARDFQLEISAGFKRGNFSIRITPDIGPAKDVKVLVK
jgi:hypothetical protein